MALDFQDGISHPTA